MDQNIFKNQENIYATYKWVNAGRDRARARQGNYQFEVDVVVDELGSCGASPAEVLMREQLSLALRRPSIELQKDEISKYLKSMPRPLVLEIGEY